MGPPSLAGGATRPRLPLDKGLDGRDSRSDPYRGHRAGCYPNNAKGERITNGGSSGFAPKAAHELQAVPAGLVREIAEASRFPSREERVISPASTRRPPRIHRTGRTMQFNARAKPEACMIKPRIPRQNRSDFCLKSGGLCEVAGARVGRREWRPHISRIERSRRKYAELCSTRHAICPVIPAYSASYSCPCFSEDGVCASKSAPSISKTLPSPSICKSIMLNHGFAQLVCQRERRSVLHAKIAAEGEHAFVAFLVTERRNCHQIALERELVESKQGARCHREICVTRRASPARLIRRSATIIAG